MKNFNLRVLPMPGLAAVFRGATACFVFGASAMAAVLPANAADEPLLAEIDSFCGVAQKYIATTKLQATIEYPANEEAFVKSKASHTPLVVQQYFSNPVAGKSAGEPLNKTLSCKMKNSGSLNKAAGKTVAQGDLTCDAIHTKILAELDAHIATGNKAVSTSDIVVDEEDVTYIGPLWLSDWPYEAVYRGEDGKIHLRSKALYAPDSWLIPMPDSFKGTYYCHLASPVYLEAIIRGEITP